jgi:DNA-binding NarL/FixJ family response regulator
MIDAGVILVGPVRTLIVDDDFYAREALRLLLARDGRTRVWGCSADVGEALEQIARAGGASEPMPQIVLLDVRLHDRELGGIEGIAELRAALPAATRILVTSISRDESTVLAALTAGGDGYVWKNESADGIADAVVRAAAGRFVVTRSIAEKLGEKLAELVTDGAEVLPGRREVSLADSVRKTLYLYAVCGMSAAEIADELQLSVNTVNGRIRIAYQALGATTRREAFELLISAEGGQ